MSRFSIRNMAKLHVFSQRKRKHRMKYSDGIFISLKYIFFLHFGHGGRTSRGATNGIIGPRWDTVDENGKLTITLGCPAKSKI